MDAPPSRITIESTTDRPMNRHWLLPLALICYALPRATAAELLIPGAGPPTQLLQALTTHFNERAGHLVALPRSSGMSGALDAVREGRAALARLPRRLTAEEQRSSLAQLVVAREAIVFATGAQVTVRSLSQAQLATIFAGTLTDWGQLGAAPAPIRVFYREDSAWASQVIRQRLHGFATLRFSPDARLVNLDPEMIEQLQRFPTSLGWSSASNVRAAAGLQILAIDGLLPALESLQSAHYALWFDVVLIHRAGALTGAARAFAEFATSPAARLLIEKLGAVPAP